MAERKKAERRRVLESLKRVELLGVVFRNSLAENNTLRGARGRA